jgi:hypothetical protein
VFSQPIEISTADQLQAIGADETSLAGEYVLVNDIDLAGYPWKAIFGFVGTFDGNGHVVKGITQNHEGQDNARAAGLFGKTLAGSVLRTWEWWTVTSPPNGILLLWLVIVLVKYPIALFPGGP